MSKLGAVGALDDNVDTSVPGVEMSDINDGDILARTREQVNSNGQFQFVYVPDDGSDPVVSDWIGQDHKKAVLRGWVDGVKQALIARGMNAINEAQEKALEERARRVREEQMPTDDLYGPNDLENQGRFAERPDNPPRARNLDRRPAERSNPVPARRVRDASPVDDDPSAYVLEQLEIAKQRLAAAEEEQRAITREVLAARQAANKWQRLAASLGHSEHDDIVDDTPVGRILMGGRLASPEALPNSGEAVRRVPNVRTGQVVSGSTRSANRQPERGGGIPDVLPIT